MSAPRGRQTPAWVIFSGCLLAGWLAGPPALAESPAPVSDKDRAAWSSHMQALYQNLAALLTDVTSNTRFNDPANRSRINSEAKRLSELAHDLTQSTVVAPDSDPTLPIVASLLSAETKRAYRALQQGERSYARGILAAVPSYCIACHTRNGTGPRFDQLPLQPVASGLSALERGEFFAATRQFDRAQTEFDQIIRGGGTPGPDAWDRSRDWQRAVEYSLAISVRVKQDPALAMATVQRILDQKDAPAFMKSDVQTWKTAVADWQKEMPRQPLTPQGRYAEAIRLLAKATQAQKYPMDRTGDIDYLRASAAAHDLLQSDPQGELASEALFIAGLSYEALSPLRMEDLHEVYYQSCIRKTPHSPIAAACFSRFEQSVYLGYTGSAGTDIPEDVRQKIAELKALAGPRPTTPQ